MIAVRFMTRSLTVRFILRTRGNVTLVVAQNQRVTNKNEPLVSGGDKLGLNFLHFEFQVEEVIQSQFDHFRNVSKIKLFLSAPDLTCLYFIPSQLI